MPERPLALRSRSEYARRSRNVSDERQRRGRSHPRFVCRDDRDDAEAAVRRHRARHPIGDMRKNARYADMRVVRSLGADARGVPFRRPLVRAARTEPRCGSRFGTATIRRSSPFAVRSSRVAAGADEDRGRWPRRIDTLRSSRAHERGAHGVLDRLGRLPRRGGVYVVRYRRVPRFHPPVSWKGPPPRRIDDHLHLRLQSFAARESGRRLVPAFPMRREL